MANKNGKESIISKIPESYQRYLDEIYIISRKKRGGWVSNKELSENLDVKPASVSGMLEKLEKQGLIDWKPRKSIRLTEKGKIIAKQLNETHELLRDFFIKVLEIPDEELVDNISCQIEHHITKKLQIKLKEFLSKYLKQI